MTYPTLNREAVAQGCRVLAQQDEVLAELYQRNGVPPMWTRPRGFATLVQLILEQQVSLASAAAVYAKLENVLSRVAPAEYLALSDETLRSCGVSRQKIRYTRLLAEKLQRGEWRLSDLHRAPADDARTMLTSLTGIGPWTADVYLLMAMRHPDVWPPGDVALIRQFEKVMPVRSIDSRRSVARIRSWAPWRAVAARLIWHDYLIERNRA
ncbi:MAG: DNA-3-methyladenine glycosylase 2 family protein [Pseudomonadota bacterium]